MRVFSNFEGVYDEKVFFVWALINPWRTTFSLVPLVFWLVHKQKSDRQLYFWLDLLSHIRSYEPLCYKQDIGFTSRPIWHLFMNQSYNRRLFGQSIEKCLELLCLYIYLCFYLQPLYFSGPGWYALCMASVFSSLPQVRSCLLPGLVAVLVS